MSGSGSAAVDWETMAELLAVQVTAWRRLLREHVPTASGHCRACTTGGTGMRNTPWPCGPQRLAARASQIHRARPT